MHSVPGMVHWCSAGRQTDQIGDQAVAEQRHLVAQLLFGVIHGGLFSVCGSCDPVLWTNYGAIAGGSGPRLCWTRFVGWSPAMPWERKPSGAASTASHGSVSERIATNTASLSRRLAVE